mgnify:CR=1 FL=1
MITRAEAKAKIANIISTHEPIKTGVTLPVRKGETFKVYRIPLDLLVPNVFNDRITWKIREYEAENKRELDIESEADVEFLYSLIMKEHPAENERTLADLARNGQQVDGVITNTGIIIDGNRRATLLRALFNGEAEKFHQSVEDFRYFNAIVLPEDMDDRKEIMAMETMLQIGADKKIDYNRICLYIKVDNLISAGYTYSQVKQYMNLKSEKDVEDMENIFELMQEYLRAIGKPNHFTLLDKLEDQFINTRTVFKRLDNGSYQAEWDYTEADIDQFKMVCYDYMRAKFEGKKYRDKLIGKPNKTDGVFIEKTVWDAFLEHHEAIIEKNNPTTEQDWELLGRKGGQFERNLNDAEQKLITVINDKDLSKLIREIQRKVDRIFELTDEMDEISTDDLINLKKLSSLIHKIAKKYE